MPVGGPAVAREPFCLARLAEEGLLERARSGGFVVRQFSFADEPFTIENEEMTPSMKIRRHKIRDRYGERLEKHYRS